MSWRSAAGVLAVLLVIGAVGGVVVTLATSNGLFTGAGPGTAALVTLGILVVGLAGVVFLGGPSREWLGNPYWE